MSDTPQKPLSFIEKMKQKAAAQTSYGGDGKEEAAKVATRDCPNCGAARARQDGLTHCGYCGFAFIQSNLTDGIHIKSTDNSQ